MLVVSLVVFGVLLIVVGVLAWKTGPLPDVDLGMPPDDPTPPDVGPPESRPVESTNPDDVLDENGNPREL